MHIVNSNRWDWLYRHWSETRTSATAREVDDGGISLDGDASVNGYPVWASGVVPVGDNTPLPIRVAVAIEAVTELQEKDIALFVRCYDGQGRSIEIKLPNYSWSTKLQANSVYWAPVANGSEPFALPDIAPPEGTRQVEICVLQWRKGLKDSKPLVGLFVAIPSENGLTSFRQLESQLLTPGIQSDDKEEDLSRHMLS